MSRRAFPRAGSTVVEAMMAVAIVAVFLVGLYQMSARAMSLLKSGLEGVSGTRILVNTLEKIRGATWDQAIDPNYLVGILSTSASTSHMNNVVQTITLESIVPTGASKIQVRRAADGSVSVVSVGDGTIPGRGAARVDVTITWKTTFNSTAHTRTMTAFLGHSGILGSNQ